MFLKIKISKKELVKLYLISSIKNQGSTEYTLPSFSSNTIIISNVQCLKVLILSYLENPAIVKVSSIHSQRAPDKPKFNINKSHLVFVLVAEKVRDWIQPGNRATTLKTFISTLFSQSLIKDIF